MNPIHASALLRASLGCGTGVHNGIEMPGAITVDLVPSESASHRCSIASSRIELNVRLADVGRGVLGLYFEGLYGWDGQGREQRVCRIEQK